MLDKNSRSYQNLLTAFAGESQARGKYMVYAEAAAREGLETTAELFEKLARNEEQHAKFWFKYIRDTDESEQNISDAIAGEHYEWTDMYMNFALQAKDEGYDDLAMMFERVASIEKNHEQRFIDMLGLLQGGEVERKDGGWVCKVCGHVEYGDQAPEECTVCKSKNSFEKD